MAQITQENNRWLLSGDMTIAHVPDLLAQSAQFEACPQVEIDLAQVTDVDSASISLIFEWLRHAAKHKCKVTFSNLPVNLASLATLYGVFEFIPQSQH